MCIIGIKEKGVDPIPTDVLKQCWDNNGHGAGYAIWDEVEECWAVRKGFMSFDALTRSLATRGLTKDHLYMVHFRYATSGLKDGGNTHPFPLFDTLDGMRKERFNTKYIALHNGSCGIGDKDYSDTMVGIVTYANPILFGLFEGYHDKDEIAPVIEKCLEASEYRSRWVFTNEDDIFLYGKGWDTDQKTGMIWSNDMHKSTVLTTRHPNYKAKTVTHYTSNWQSKWNNRSGKFERFNYITNKWEEYSPTGATAYGDERPKQTENKGVYTDPTGKIIIPSVKPGGSLRASTVYIAEDGQLMWEDEEDEMLVSVMCPSCYQDEFLEETTYTQGHYVCTWCGSVFNKDTGEIMFVDPTIKTYIESI